jgi:hypothetical protein
MTVTTPVGGLAKFLISTIAFLSRLYTAFWAASRAGLAAESTASASSAIYLAAAAFLSTMAASAETLASYSFAIALSLLTIIKAAAKSIFFFSKMGFITVNFSANSAIFALVELSLLTPLASLPLF